MGAFGSDATACTAEPTAMLPETPPTTPPCGSYFSPATLPSGLAPAMGFGGFGGRKLVRRNSSLSVASSMGSEDGEEDTADWTEEERDKLKRTVDVYLQAAATTSSPFSGAPPSNLTHVIARAVVSNKAERNLRATARAGTSGDSSSASESEQDDEPPAVWKHGLKSTRAKIIALVRERESNVEETPRQNDPDATPRRTRIPMVRQGSMDFLPPARNVGIVARLGSKLQRAENGPPPSHPYAAASRSGRMHRTNSLSSIAGSPTQPKASSSTTVRPPPAAAGGSMARASSRMLRVASDNSAGHHSSSDTFQSSDYFNFHRTAPVESSGSLHPTMALDLSERQLPSSRAASALLGLAFSEASTTKPRKKLSTPGGLASAFHSPALSYPSPISLKKKKASPGEELVSKKQRREFDSAAESNDLEMAGTPSPTPTRALDAFPFFSTTLTTPSGRNTSPHEAARANFYLGGHAPTSGMSLASSASSSSWTPSSYTSSSTYASSASSNASASTLSLNGDDSYMGMRTPSPMSSTFDLDELSLGKEDDEDRKSTADEHFKGWSWGQKVSESH
ncbi:hypothetical protein RQP46_002863 [Phenoliferia psychrophenolica]